MSENWGFVKGLGILLNTHLSFHILGALDVRADGRRVAVGGPRQRTVLAMLLLAADRVVSVDSLVESIWNGRPPATGRTQVAICIAGLRKTFKVMGCTEDVIVTASPGYLLVTGKHRLDAAEFTAHVEAAHAAVAQGRNAEAADMLGAALELWNGPALLGVSGSLAETEAARLEEQRLTAYELRTALRLELGQHRTLISELNVAVRQHPLREQVRSQLMLAQYRAGRRAEALETFRQGRLRSIEDIGMEPGVELQRLHDSILRDDGSLQPRPAEPASYPGVVTPAQFPPDVPNFVGRDHELSILDYLVADERPGRAPMAGFVTGTGGVGTTCLALHWAHRAAEKFPDGQLFADLHGYDEDIAPVDPSTVLASFLRALGVPNERIPTDAQERATLYRSVLSGRRVLVLLDNAGCSSQVLPLLPGNGDCRVVVTGRRPHGELLGGHAAVRVRLAPLSESEATSLLTALIGDGRADDDPVGVRRLAELCGRLPLALRIAGTQLAAKAHWSVRHLVDRLADPARRLDLLDGTTRELRGRLEPSYRRLTPAAARMYRLLSLVEPADFPGWLGAALTDSSEEEAEKAIEQLVDAQLIGVAFTAPGGVRYRLRGLLRLHAAEHARAEDDSAQRGRAIERVLGGWLCLAGEAYRRTVGHPHSAAHQLRPAWQPSQAMLTELLAEPLGWFDQERHALLVAAERYAGPGSAAEAAGLAAITHGLCTVWEDTAREEDRHPRRVRQDALLPAQDHRPSLGRSAGELGLSPEVFHSPAEP